MVTISDASADLIGEADRAAAAGDIGRARKLLEGALGQNGGDLDTWLKLAALARADGDIAAALTATSRALAFEPLHFVALLLKATLLDRLGHDDAGECYGQALAQRPAGEAMPPQLKPIVAQAERRLTQYHARQAQRLAVASAVAEAHATTGEAARIRRFRSNILRQTAVFHSEPTHFHYPGLAESEFHDRALFPWLAMLEAATDTIAAEFAALLEAEQAELVPYIQYPADVPLRQWASLNYSRDWTAIHLLRNGRVVDENARHCPGTMKTLEAIPQPAIPGCSPNAMFSLLAPGTHIPPHVGVANTRLVCHLPLIVPEGCWFRVGAERRCWTPGEAFVFDDTIEHEAANESAALRVVFILDVWQPGLNERERAAVAALMAAGGGINAGLG